MPTRPRPNEDRRRYTWSASAEIALALACLFWALALNRPFLGAALQGHPGGGWAAAGFATALVLGISALHFLMLAPLAWRWTFKPLLAVLIVGTAFASYFMQRWGVYLDPDMMRNVLRTDPQEARELFGWAMLPQLLAYALLPLLLLWRLRLRPRRSLLTLLAWRLGAAAFAALLLVGAVISVYQPLASLMRNQPALRYRITPGNYVWSLAIVAGLDARTASGPKTAIGLDAAPGPSWAGRTKPRVVVLVVGETARAANWGLDGYARATTPELARLPVISFTDVTACGTATEVSLPCMFAPVGRRDYDEATIRRSETLLQLVARAGVAVRWRDNQSGCKGVCDGMPVETMIDRPPPGLCADGRCLDEALLSGLGGWLDGARGTRLLVLHMLGNHGPSYFRRYPPAFRHFVPACEQDDLQRCSQAEIVNAYDNALRYSDHVLAQLLDLLRARAARVDSALIYVSDHGESLGENGLYLHGLPWAIAPDVQKKVPMLIWLSAGLQNSMGVDESCLRRRAAKPASHDNLFHTLLALLDVHTALYAPDWDLTSGCRAGPTDAPAH